MLESKSEYPSCSICGRTTDQLKPFRKVDRFDLDELEIANIYLRVDSIELDEPDIFLRIVKRDYFGFFDKSWECSECIGVPVDPWEIYGDPRIFLLYRNIDNDTWESPVFTWEDKKLDRLLSDEEGEQNRDEIEDPLLEEPKYNFIFRQLQHHEVEKIKAAPGKTIIIITKREETLGDGRKYMRICMPPEIIKNWSSAS